LTTQSAVARPTWGRAAAAPRASPPSAQTRGWAAIEELATREGCSVVGELGGHGIGRAMHEPPLREGMAITIEP
jgi:methionine aminopeptidase